MRLDIRYQMTFAYDRPVREAQNELRVRPRDLPWQRLLAHRLTCDPQARVLSFTDYWGTNVDHLGVVPEHGEFSLVAEAAVETRPRESVDNADAAAYGDEAFRLTHLELLAESPHVQWDDAIAAVANDAVSGSPDAEAVIRSTVAATRELLRYERDSTRIGIPLTELVQGGRGVCQDFAHLNIGLLRAVGVPARYVSGYLFAADETDLSIGAAADADANANADTARDGDTVSVQTHAWVEAAVPGSGWLAVDPTNDQPVGDRHVVIGFGRDYDDVAPVRGVYSGDGVAAVDAAVEMRRMEPVARTMTARPRRRLRPPIVESIDPAAVAAQQQQQQQ